MTKKHEKLSRRQRVKTKTRMLRQILCGTGLSFITFEKVNNKGADQPVWMS